MKTDKADDDYTMKLKAVYKVPNPTAVLYNDGTLIFYESAPDSADEASHSGIMPQNETYPEDGLSIYPGLGSWATETFTSHSDCPWRLHDSDIITVQFKGNVKPKSTAYWFHSVSSLKTFISEGLDTSEVQDISYMFDCCHKLSNVDGLDTWDTNNVTYMSGMFYECREIAELDLSDWDVSNVTDMDLMFCDCEKITKLNLSNWDVSNIINMSGMFVDCYRLQELNLSNWNPKKVEKITSAFNNLNKKGSSFAKIYAQDWTTNENINKSNIVVFNNANVSGYQPIKIFGDMCKPQSMGGYFTDPQ